MPLARCKWYDDSGVAIKGGCRRIGRGCEFVHPSDAAWNNAPPSKHRVDSAPDDSGRGRGRGRGQGRGRGGRGAFNASSTFGTGANCTPTGSKWDTNANSTTSVWGTPSTRSAPAWETTITSADEAWGTTADGAAPGWDSANNGESTTATAGWGNQAVTSNGSGALANGNASGGWGTPAPAAKSGWDAPTSAAKSGWDLPDPQADSGLGAPATTTNDGWGTSSKDHATTSDPWGSSSISTTAAIGGQNSWSNNSASTAVCDYTDDKMDESGAYTSSAAMLDKLPRDVILSPLYPEERLEDEPALILSRRVEEPSNESLDSYDISIPTSIFEIDEGDPYSSFMKALVVVLVRCHEYQEAEPRQAMHTQLKQTQRHAHVGERAKDILRRVEEADELRLKDISVKRDEAFRELERMAERLRSPPSEMTDEEVLGIEDFISQVTKWLQTVQQAVRRRDDVIEDNEVAQQFSSIREQMNDFKLQLANLQAIHEDNYDHSLGYLDEAMDAFILGRISETWRPKLDRLQQDLDTFRAKEVEADQLEGSGSRLESIHAEHEASMKALAELEAANQSQEDELSRLEKEAEKVMEAYAVVEEEYNKAFIARVEAQVEELVKREHAVAFEELKKGVEERLAAEHQLICTTTFQQLEPTFKLTIAYSKELEKIKYEEYLAEVDNLAGAEQISAPAAL